MVMATLALITLILFVVGIYVVARRLTPVPVRAQKATVVPSLRCPWVK
jgi:hypothetical protein